jgi:HPt (histidine-containing phosphotransfer) domain-containing protein
MCALLGDARTVGQIERFLGETDDLVAELAGAVAAGVTREDARALVASVHRVAGSAAILGATAMRECLARLEAGLAAGGDATGPDVEALRDVATDTARALRQVMAGIAPSGR